MNFYQGAAKTNSRGGRKNRTIIIRALARWSSILYWQRECYNSELNSYDDLVRGKTLGGGALPFPKPPRSIAQGEPYKFSLPQPVAPIYPRERQTTSREERENGSLLPRCSVIQKVGLLTNKPPATSKVKPYPPLRCMFRQVIFIYLITNEPVDRTEPTT